MPEFGVAQAVVLVVLTLLASGGTWRVVKLWSDERIARRIFKTMRSWWFWGDALLRGWIRALPVGLGALWITTGSTTLAALLATESIESSLGFLALAGLVVLFFVCFVVMGSVMLVNRPRFAVPPYLRREPGALEEWRSARRRRKRPA